jgi:hypothetical protein
MTFSSVDKLHHTKSKGYAFVDDTGLGCTSHNQESTPQEHKKLIEDLQKLAQEWEQLLFSTGGALNLQKCFWFLLTWKWNNGHVHYALGIEAPGELCMTSGNALNSPTVIK